MTVGEIQQNGYFASIFPSLGSGGLEEGLAERHTRGRELVPSRHKRRFPRRKITIPSGPEQNVRPRAQKAFGMHYGPPPRTPAARRSSCRTLTTFKDREAFPTSRFT